MAESGDAGTVLGNRHRDLAGCTGVAVADQAAVGFMGNVPKLDAGFRKQVRDRHEGRADDTKAMLNAMHLQNFDESFFCGHLHGERSSCP